MDNSEEMYQPSMPDEIEESVEPKQSPLARVQGSIRSGLDFLKQSTSRKSLKDLFEMPTSEDNDIDTDDLFELSTEDIMGGDEDLSDLTSVSNEDIMGRPIMSRKKRIKRVQRSYIQPPSSMGGLNI